MTNDGVNILLALLHLKTSESRVPFGHYTSMLVLVGIDGSCTKSCGSSEVISPPGSAVKSLARFSNKPLATQPSANSLSPLHPYFGCVFSCFAWSHLDLPDFQLIAPAISFACVEVKRPVMLWTRNTRAQHDPKVLNVERRSIGKWV